MDIIGKSHNDNYKMSEFGIRTNMLNELYYQTINFLNADELSKLKEIFSKLKNEIRNEHYLKQLLSRMELIKKYGEFEIDNNLFMGTIKKDIEYNLRVNITPEGVSYFTNCSSSKTNGHYLKTKSGYIIQYEDINENIVYYLDMENHNLKNELHNKLSKEKLSYFNDNDFEEERVETINNVKYLYDRKVNDISFDGSVCGDNFIETKHYNRMNKKVFYNHVKHFMHDYLNENHKEEYYFADDTSVNSKEIPTLLYFAGITKKQYDYALKNNGKVKIRK